MINDSAKNSALLLANQQFKTRVSRKPRSFVSLMDLNKEEMKNIIQRGVDMKESPKDFSSVLKGLSIALLFQKTSTRTRCSFENAAIELGAFPAYIDWRTSNFVLADLRDEIIVLSRFYDVIMARVLKNETLQIMAENSESPIINGMCDRMHPCQALGDFMTISEFFGDDLNGLHITYIGDGNNVCRSLVHGAINMGAKITLCSPQGYMLDQETISLGKGLVSCVDSPAEAVRNADIIYTDTWISMGDEGQTEKRLAAFQHYQVNAALLALAPKHALFMHCLPAHPNQEVTPDVLRGARSIVFDQAENRTNAQTPLLEKFVLTNTLYQRKSAPLNMVEMNGGQHAC